MFLTTGPWMPLWVQASPGASLTSSPEAQLYLLQLAGSSET